MARTLEFQTDALIVRLTGLTRFAALRGVLRIPYTKIQSVSAEPFHMPAGSIRVGGTSLPFTDYRQGNFWKRGIGWFFLSYEHADKTVTLQVDNLASGRFDFSMVVLGADDPAAVAAEIDTHRRSSR
ncbi:MAG: hypothetical protein AB7R89_08585 [Dehalococcoidia bacterium]